MFFCLIGIFIANRIFYDTWFFIRIWSGLSIGVICTMWLVIPFSFLFGFSFISHALALFLMIAFYFIIRRFYKEKGDLKYTYNKQDNIFFLVTLPLFIIISYILYTHVIYPGSNGALYGGQSTYGDLSLHLGIITSIATQGKFPPEYSIFPGKILSYPFLADSMSSTLYLFGTNLRWAVLIPSFVMTIIVILGIFIFSREIIKNEFVAALCTILFFLNGGFGFIYFMDGIMKDPSNFLSIFTSYYKTPTNYNEHFIRWSNTICDMLVPQRTTLAGWSILLFALWILYKAIVDKNKKYFVYSGIIASLLPMIHTHSFLAFGIISFVWSIVYFFEENDKTSKYVHNFLKYSSLIILITFIIIPKIGGIITLVIVLTGLILTTVYILNKTNKKDVLDYFFLWLHFLIPVIIFAVPQILYWTLPQSSEGNFLRFQSGWSANEGDLWCWFWIKNVGLSFILLIPALLAAKTKMLKLFSGATLLFAISNTILFQPNNYDNNKLLYIWYIFVIILVSAYIVTIYNRLKDLGGRKFLMAIIIFTCSFSGILTIGREINSSNAQLYSSAAVSSSEFIKMNTPKDALFISADEHLNPVSSLAGRNIYCGTSLYLSFHGINISPRTTEIEKMYKNPEEFKTISDKINLDYVYFSDYEKNKYKIDKSYFEKNYPLIFQKDDIFIFAVSNRAQKYSSEK